MIQFYAPDIEQTLTLPESDSAHAVRVLRMKPGDSLVVVDGKGNRFNCILETDHAKHAVVAIESKEFIAPFWPAPITVAVAPTKHLDRMEWLLEKLTEQGFDRFVPLLCRYSERKEIKTERLEKIAVSAMKQSLKTTLPAIEPMTRIIEFIKNDKSEQRFIAYCDPSIPRRLLADEYKPGQSVSILIGPEGDFSKEEITMALEAGYMPVSLGEARLRTESAALTACTAFHVLNQLKTK
ncbi:MAG: 16S rRNA (uracil(1498)-N(3))-methyltransferase [Muribaculaceae bacterium]|nr:16S rRNA (uracil(1498)-N(3))-methyltransferase [Muribaculaceae bacterium]